MTAAAQPAAASEMDQERDTTDYPPALKLSTMRAGSAGPEVVYSGEWRENRAVSPGRKFMAEPAPRVARPPNSARSRARPGVD